MTAREQKPLAADRGGVGCVTPRMSPAAAFAIVDPPIMTRNRMFVSQVCKRNVIAVRKHDEVTEAARLMRDRHVGYVVVVEPDFAGSTERPVGVLTDRDIVVGLVAQN